MTNIPLPLRIRQTPGGFSIEESSGRIVCYVYCRDDELVYLRNWTRVEAREISQLIARAVTDHLEKNRVDSD